MKIKKRWLVISEYVSPIVLDFPEIGKPLSTGVAFFFRFSAKKYADRLQRVSDRNNLLIEYRTIKVSEWNEASSDAAST